MLAKLTVLEAVVVRIYQYMGGIHMAPESLEEERLISLLMGSLKLGDFDAGSDQLPDLSLRRIAEIRVGRTIESDDQKPVDPRWQSGQG